MSTHPLCIVNRIGTIGISTEKTPKKWKQLQWKIKTDQQNYLHHQELRFRQNPSLPVLSCDDDGVSDSFLTEDVSVMTTPPSSNILPSSALANLPTGLDVCKVLSVNVDSTELVFSSQSTATSLMLPTRDHIVSSPLSSVTENSKLRLTLIKPSTVTSGPSPSTDWNSWFVALLDRIIEQIRWTSLVIKIRVDLTLDSILMMIVDPWCGLTFDFSAFDREIGFHSYMSTLIEDRHSQDEDRQSRVCRSQDQWTGIRIFRGSVNLSDNKFVKIW